MDRDKLAILLIDDDEDDFILTENFLSDIKTFESSLEWISDFDAGMEALKENRHDIYLVDYRLGLHSGIELLEAVREFGIRKPMIMLTGQGEPEVDLQAMRAGAADYLIKGEINSSSLERSIRYALERFKVLARLEEEEARFRNLYEKSVDSIFIVSADMELLEVNPAMTTLIGYSEEEFRQMSLGDLFEFRDEYERFIKELDQKAEVKGMEMVIRSKKGNRMNCLITGVRQTHYDGSTKGYQGIIHDITQRKRAEKQLMWAEKQGMTGRVARTIAHEVRNPLTNINLAIEQLRMELTEENTMVDAYIDIIGRSSKRINSLIVQLLDSAKPSTLNLKKFSINDIVDETLQLAQDRIQLQEIKVRKSYSDQLPLLQIDKEKFMVALLNIIINAIEAMDASQGVLDLKTVRTREHVKIIIEDNGKGMTQETLSRLFDPFYTDKKSGTGLGLTATQNIIASHQGAIEVDSEPGQGSRFTIMLAHKVQTGEEQGSLMDQR